MPPQPDERPMACPSQEGLFSALLMRLRATTLQSLLPLVHLRSFARSMSRLVRLDAKTASVPKMLQRVARFSMQGFVVRATSSLQ